jgi:hypothetical protein
MAATAAAAGSCQGQSEGTLKRNVASLNSSSSTRNFSELGPTIRIAIECHRTFASGLACVTSSGVLDLKPGVGGGGGISIRGQPQQVVA